MLTATNSGNMLYIQSRFQISRTDTSTENVDLAKSQGCKQSVVVRRFRRKTFVPSFLSCASHFLVVQLMFVRFTQTCGYLTLFDNY